jgi:TolB-like protein
VDFDRGLNFCISQIRSALKDDSAAPTYIRTIPKQGYQLIAPVERISESGPSLDAKGSQTGDAATSRGYRRMMVLATATLVVVVLVVAAGRRFLRRPSTSPAPIVAVLRFDNETGDSGMTPFSDALTDTVVERLTSLSQGRYQVIGNAQILRLPREQRDLNAIGSSLHAAYVVLGQVQRNDVQRNDVQRNDAQRNDAQRNDAQRNEVQRNQVQRNDDPRSDDQRNDDQGKRGPVRILAHLIRLPEQTHLWVARTERTLADPLAVESEVAEKIATEFSPRVAADSNHKNASLPAANH